MQRRKGVFLPNHCPFGYETVHVKFVYVRRTSGIDIDDVPRDKRRPAAQVRRRSVPLYGRGNKTDNNNDDSSDDSDSVPSLHRDPLHRRNVLIWRDHWQRPGPVNRLPSAADRNNNDNDDVGKSCNRFRS